MKHILHNHLWRGLAALAALLSLSGCVASTYQQGQNLMRIGEYDRAVTLFQQAAQANPKKLEYQTALERARLTASQAHFEKAKRLVARGLLEQAVAELEMALNLDPTNKYAQDQLVQAVEAVREMERSKRVKDLSIEEMKREAASDDGRPKLRADANVPIVLKFNDTPVRKIFDAISKASGINFLYDDQAQLEKRITVDLSGVNMERAMDILMLQSGNFYKVVDDNTVIVVPDNKNKRQEYEEQVIKTFYLSNADAKEVFQVVRTLVDTKRAAQNKDLNSITIRDAPEKVAVIGKIIEAMDKSKGEIVVDVELLEINNTRLKTLGIDFGNSTSITPESSSIGLPDLGDVAKKAFWSISIPSIALSYMKQDSLTRVLARPQVRVAENGKASVHIGDRVPIPTTQFQNVGGTGNLQPITSYTYQDVGVKIQLEPKVHHNKEVTLKLHVTVSAVTGQVESTNGPSQPLIGQREIETEIRLADGETNLLAGLFREEDGMSYRGIPGLGDIPVLKRLFGTQNDRNTTTDIVLLLTPHIVRVPNISSDDLSAWWVGTEDTLKLRDEFQSSFSTNPFKATGDAPAADAAEDPLPPSTKPEPKIEPVVTPPAETPAPAESPDPDASFKPEQPPAASPTLDFSPQVVRQQTGRDLRLNVSVLNGQALNLKRAELEIQFDPGALEYLGAEAGFLLRLGGREVQLSDSSLGPGKVTVLLERQAEDGVNSSGVLSRLQFRLSQAKESQVTITRATLTSADGKSWTVQAPAVTVQPM